jgi:hypothetical protein
MNLIEKKFVSKFGQETKKANSTTTATHMSAKAKMLTQILLSHKDGLPCNTIFSPRFCNVLYGEPS